MKGERDTEGSVSSNVMHCVDYVDFIELTSSAVCINFYKYGDMANHLISRDKWLCSALCERLYVQFVDVQRDRIFVGI